MRLHGQVSIVTGGAQGIGLAIAARLAAEGSALLIADLNAEGAERAARSLNDSGATALAMGADVTSDEGRARIVSAALERHGRIDVLVNNAGILPRVPLMEVTPEVWHRTMQVNLDAAFFCSQAVLPAMREQGRGRIINISSMSARTGGQASPPHYATSKTGLVGMTRALARVVGAWGVTVNAVAPGMIDTEMLAALTPEQRRWWLEQIPLARLGTPEDVAAAVAFLASDDAAYITGTTLDVNGGYFMI
jgi:NAD(P)-dependent dehydrogenase (short-subunit alcohol dehydrogenase family)